VSRDQAIQSREAIQNATLKLNVNRVMDKNKVRVRHLGLVKFAV
jgi:hypothetical protein